MPKPRVPHRLDAVSVIVQRENADCAVSVLAMLAGVSYEDALRVVCNVDDEGASDGLYLTQLIEAANALGIPLRTRRRFKLHNATGVLYLVSCRNDDDRHVVLLRGGVLINTNGMIWTDAAKFCRFYRYQPRALLVELKDE